MLSKSEFFQSVPDNLKLDLFDLEKNLVSNHSELQELRVRNEDQIKQKSEKNLLE